MRKAVTEAYYRENAVAYAETTAGLLPEVALRHFTVALPPPARLLDAGCGCGRDTHWFRQRGYDVDAFDACPELAAEAMLRFDVPARVASMLDLEGVGFVDGVWASASLVHMPPSTAAEALRRLARALTPGGVLYASVKEGSGPGIDTMGRSFHYWPAHEFVAAVLAAAPGLTLLETWTNPATLDPKGAGCVSVLVRAAP